MDVARTLLKKSEVLITYFIPPIRVAENIKAIASNGKCPSLGRVAFVEQFAHLPRRGQGVAVGKAFAGSSRGRQGAHGKSLSST